MNIWYSNKFVLLLLLYECIFIQFKTDFLVTHYSCDTFTPSFSLLLLFSFSSLKAFRLRDFYYWTVVDQCGSWRFSHLARAWALIGHNKLTLWAATEARLGSGFSSFVQLCTVQVYGCFTKGLIKWRKWWKWGQGVCLGFATSLVFIFRVKWNQKFLSQQLSVKPLGVINCTVLKINALAE